MTSERKQQNMYKTKLIEEQRQPVPRIRRKRTKGSYNLKKNDNERKGTEIKGATGVFHVYYNCYFKSTLFYPSLCKMSYKLYTLFKLFGVLYSNPSPSVQNRQGFCLTGCKLKQPEESHRNLVGGH